MRAMFQARPTPMETTKTAGSMFQTISSMELLLPLDSDARDVAEEEFALDAPERDVPPSRGGPRPKIGGRKGGCATLAAAAAAATCASWLLW